MTECRDINRLKLFRGTGSNSSATTFGEKSLYTHHACPYVFEGAELKVKLPPKAAFLRVHLTNRETGAPVSGIQVKVMLDTSPPSMVFSMSCFSTKTILLPPDKNLLVHITSDGFQEWKDSAGKSKMLHLRSGSQMILNVELDPTA